MQLFPNHRHKLVFLLPGNIFSYYGKYRLTYALFKKARDLTADSLIQKRLFHRRPHPLHENVIQYLESDIKFSVQRCPRDRIVAEISFVLRGFPLCQGIIPAHIYRLFKAFLLLNTGVHLQIVKLAQIVFVNPR